MKHVIDIIEGLIHGEYGSHYLWAMLKGIVASYPVLLILIVIFSLALVKKVIKIAIPVALAIILWIIIRNSAGFLPVAKIVAFVEETVIPEGSKFITGIIS